MKLHRYSTALAEVQAAVQKIREWVDNGVDPANVAVVAPDIETYWPALSRYLSYEGIAANKATVMKVSSSKDIQQLLARLKIIAGKCDRSSLETFLFAKDAPEPYSEFEKKFANFYGTHQLQGLELPKEITSQNMTLRDFANEVLKEWPSSSTSGRWLEPVIKNMLAECDDELAMDYALWLNYFERVCAKTEITLTEAQSHGLQAVGLTSADWLTSEYVWAMGLTEENLKAFEPMGLTFKEVMSLSAQTGFQLPLPDERQKEFAARWFFQRNFADAHLSTAGTDFAGTPQAPSLVWLEQSQKQNIDHEKIEIPGATRLRELQQAAEPPTELLEKIILPSAISLSASSIEDYLKCPFIFAAKKLLRLKDEPAMDLDLDHMSRGRLQHALFEALTLEPMRFDWTDNEILKIIDKTKSLVELGEEAFWPVLRRKYLDMAKDFLEFEHEWRTQMPLTMTVARELKIKAQWSQKQKKFLLSDDGQDMFPFSGRIDRVDSNGQGQIVLIDYKASKGDHRHWKTWLKDGELQLALYWLVLTDGATEVSLGEVVGACYYILSAKERKKGFRFSSGENLGLFAPDDRSKNTMTAQERDQFLSDLRELLAETVEHMRAGEFLPQPKDFKHCDKCHWRSMCRAPHLN